MPVSPIVAEILIECAGRLLDQPTSHTIDDLLVEIRQALSNVEFMCQKHMDTHFRLDQYVDLRYFS
jgi:HEPN domain-containing protein